MNRPSSITRRLVLFAVAAIGLSVTLPAAARMGDPKDPKWKRPEKVVVTTPTPGSQLTDAKTVRVAGTGKVGPRVGGYRFHNVQGKITATYLPATGTKRVHDTRWRGTKDFYAVTDKNGKWEVRAAELPTLETGWRDVLYEFKITQSARPERDDHPEEEINPLVSEPVVFEVSPLNQPAPPPAKPEPAPPPPAATVTPPPPPASTAITAPIIQSPAPNAKVEPTVQVKGLKSRGMGVRMTITMLSRRPKRSPKEPTRTFAYKLGTFTVPASDAVEWTMPPVHLRPSSRADIDYKTVTYEIEAVQVAADERESKPTKITVLPLRPEHW